MAEQKKPGKKPEDQRRVAPNPGGESMEDRIRTPSQAEGERDLVEQDLAEKSGQAQQRGAGQSEHVIETEDDTQLGMDIVHTPSQAEGDRETIERDLEQKQG